MTIAELNQKTSIELDVKKMGETARIGAWQMSDQTTANKNCFLTTLADLLNRHQDEILQANAIDVEHAQAQGCDAAFIDRLSFNQARIASMIESVYQIAKLPDLIGEVTDLQMRPSGIQVGKMRVPLGVIAMLYEARPNVTIDAAALCVKSGNAVILRGGSEAKCSNLALFLLIQQALVQAGLPKQAVQLIENTDRAVIHQLIQLPEYVDVLIPRGGKSLITYLMQESRVPMIKHLDGICHVYIDQFADFDKALAICNNAKTQRYGTCNTMETLLVAREIAPRVLPSLAKIYQSKHVELRVDAQATAILQAQGIHSLKFATQADWETEYLAPILSIKVVQDMDEAIHHIDQFGSKHTDAIITEHYSRAQYFLRKVDSANVMVNASTRFADGFEYGLGAEIGISNDKLHARGPVGLAGLTSLKYIVLGHGEVRN